MLGLRFCARAFSSCGEWGPLFIAVRGPLTTAASLVAEHRLQTRRLSSCGSRAQLLRGMWNLPRPGLEPVSPALAGGFSTAAPPGKPNKNILKKEGWIYTNDFRFVTKECFLAGFLAKRLLLRGAFLHHHLCSFILEFLFLFLNFGHAAWLAGSYFPDQGLNLGPQQ